MNPRWSQAWVALLSAAAVAGCGPRDEAGDGGGNSSDGGPDAGVVAPGSDGGANAPGVDSGVVAPGVDGGVIGPGNMDASLVGPGSGPVDAGYFDGGCNEVAQIGSPVNEGQVNTAPPVAVGGWYPDGMFVLISATVYTGPGGATGPDGNSYSLTLVIISEGATDLYQFVQSQPGQPDYRYTISANLMHMPGTESGATWTCPGCGDSCDGGVPALPYDGTTTSLTLYVPGKNGTTIAQTFQFLHL